MKKRRYFRSHNQLMEDLLDPQEGIHVEPDDQDFRHMAVREVLRRISPEDYKSLRKLVDDFSYFIPPESLSAKVQPFPLTTEADGIVPFAKVLYLSPCLERRAFDVVAAKVAHELAHLVLKHKFYPIAGEGPAQEESARELVRQWGFEREMKKNEAAWKRYNTRQKRLLEQL